MKIDLNKYTEFVEGVTSQQSNETEGNNMRQIAISRRIMLSEIDQKLIPNRIPRRGRK